MKKNKGFIILGIFLFVFFMIIVWIVYSSIFFLELYSPSYVVGISHPFTYYQKHIGTLLINHGKEFDLSTKEQVYTSKFENQEHGWAVGYNNNFDFDVQEYSNDVGEYITFFQKNNKQKKCGVDVRYKGRGVGVAGLPRKRNLVEKKISKDDNDLLYFYAKNKQVVRYMEYEKKENGFINAGFISLDGNNFINFTTYYDDYKCKDLMKNTLATFEFFEQN